MKNILVTGGTGYIGSHTVVELINSGYTPIIVDDLSNSNIKVLDRIEQITGVKPVFYQVNISNQKEMSDIFTKHKIDGVIHFAAFKAVGESVSKPLEYYDNNVAGSISLLKNVKIHNVNTFVFSSSATVYGDVGGAPITEDFPLNATSPYGSTKIMIELVLGDLTYSNPPLKAMSLRYFNPVGAHKSGLIGEDPKGTPNNLMPYISQVAVGRREYLNVFGNDYPTHDGTGVRDYIHVVDLAIGHVKALEYFDNPDSSRFSVVNLGTGRGYSVLDVVTAFEKACGRKIDYKILPRRDGDVAICYANTNLAKKLLNFSAKYGIEEMCIDSWNWQSKNPNGYE